MTATAPEGPQPPARVAVVVPAYQAADFVGASLASVVAQTFTAWTCVVIDDGSTDGTAAVVRQRAIADPRIRLVQQENRGLPAARNAGIAAVPDGVDFLAFLDADDLWAPEALERLVDLADRNPAAVGVYGYAELVDEEGRPLQPGLHPARQRDRRRVTAWRLRPVHELEAAAFDEWVVNGPLWPPAVGLHRYDAVVRVGGFDPSLKQLEDWDLYLRMSRQGDFVPLGEVIASYRQHGTQMTRRRAEFWFAHDTVRHKAWACPDNDRGQRRAVARAWRIAQVRRIVRCSVRLAGAVRSRRWADGRRLCLGLGVLVVQLLRGRPPRARWEHVVWTGRDV